MTREDGTTYKLCWAKSNLCETGLCADPEDYGDYYAWGEMEPKETMWRLRYLEESGVCHRKRNGKLFPLGVPGPGRTITDTPSEAYLVWFGRKDVSWVYYYRYIGYSVRPVWEE